MFVLLELFNDVNVFKLRNTSLVISTPVLFTVGISIHIIHTIQLCKSYFDIQACFYPYHQCYRATVLPSYHVNCLIHKFKNASSNTSSNIQVFIGSVAWFPSHFTDRKCDSRTPSNDHKKRLLFSIATNPRQLTQPLSSLVFRRTARSHTLSLESQCVYALSTEKHALYGSLFHRFCGGDRLIVIRR